MERRRIDALLADRGLAGSRTSAAASVRAGRVRIGRDGPRAAKPSQLVPGDAELLVDEAPRYVSRGGVKLEQGLDGARDRGRGALMPRRRRLDGGLHRLPAPPRRRPGDRARRRPRPARLGASQRPARRRPRARQCPRAPRGGSSLPTGARDDRRLVHLARQGAAGGRLPAWRRAARSSPWSSPSSSSARGRVRGGVVRSASERREALREVAGAAQRIGLRGRGVRRLGASGAEGKPRDLHLVRPRGTGLRDVEAAIREVEP